MPPNRFESEVESFLEGSHGDRTHIKRADHHTVTPLCGTLLRFEHADRLITYPDAPFLSGCAVPIRMRRSYPDTRFLSRCAVPIQMRRSYPDASFLSRCEATSPPTARLTPSRTRTTNWPHIFSRIPPIGRYHADR